MRPSEDNYKVRYERLLGQRDDLRAQLAAIEEREAACCPEDVPFDDYVRSLQKQLAAANERAEWLNDEAGRASSDLSFARDENEQLLRNLKDAKSDLAAANERLSQEESARVAAWASFDKQREEWVAAVNEANEAREKAERERNEALSPHRMVNCDETHAQRIKGDTDE